MSNIYALLSKHQIQHGLENDEARIEAFISELEKEVEKIIGPNDNINNWDNGSFYTNELRNEQRDTKTKFFRGK